MGDKKFNVFEINELCISIGITCVEPCKVSPQVNEEAREYPCTLDMEQNQKFNLEFKDEMTWSRGDKHGKALAYFDNSVADRQRKKSVMTQEGDILFQEGDQPMMEGSTRNSHKKNVKIEPRKTSFKPSHLLNQQRQIINQLWWRLRVRLLSRLFLFD